MSPLRKLLLLGMAGTLPIFASAAEFAFTNLNITVPDGFTVELAAGPPLVGHPMMACFDERGRLFIAEAAGTNGVIEILEQITPNFIRMIEDTDGDGKFDKSTVFADKLQIPNGALWHDGSLYVAEPPGIWKFTDTDGDGIADKREHIAGRVKSNGMSSTLHGPVLGPTGRLFWCGGQGGYSLDKNQPFPNHRITPGVFTLKTDGTEHEPWSIGGLANPVEVCFSPEGEVFGTVAILDHDDGARHDALMHWVYGGVYNISPNDPLSLKETGPHLPPLSHVGQVAPAGTMRYRGAQFGEESRDNIFWAQFNTHKLIRTQIKRKGATFESKDEDFLVGDNVDFHVTDVFEDADGSLLVVDTGGWFRWGCPTSQLAKPDVKGGIYRIRKTGAKPLNDPRGKEIDWQKATPQQLANWLDDPRFAVEDRAVAELARKGDRATKTLLQTIRQSASEQVRRDVVWAAARSDEYESLKGDRLSPAARAARSIVYLGLADKSPSVRQSAVYAVGMARDKQAVSQLLKLVIDDPHPSIRREAATALGRIGDGSAVPKLLEALRNKNDQFLEHSIIYALIQLNRPTFTEPGLNDSNARVRRGALLALSKMGNAEISRGQLLVLLKDNDLDLQRAAFEVANRNTNTVDDLAGVLREWFHDKLPTEERMQFLREAALKQATNVLTQKVIADTLAETNIATGIRLLLLETIKRANVKEIPAIWLIAVENEIKKGDIETRLAAVAVLQERGNKKLDDLLKQLAGDEKQPPRLRIAMLNVLAPRLKPVPAEFVDLLQRNLRPEAVSLIRLNAARTFASMTFSEEQLVKMADALPQIDPLVLPTVLRSFTRNTNDSVGLALAAGLDKTPAAANLSPDELGRMFNKYSPTVQKSAKPLLQRLGADFEKQQAMLESLLPLTQGGDFSRGKAVFFGKKSGCSNCHRISGQGGVVGPNLSKIGSIRNGRDLLESILFPSASIVQGYHPFNIETDDDQLYSGIITRETPEAVWIRGTDLVENKVEQKHIKSIRESAVSVMPAGFGDVLSKDELRDLLGYLLECKEK